MNCNLWIASGGEMAEKTNVIKKKDFEKYRIVLPFFSSAGKRRKSFLCAELEKIHPCFSDEFCFDSSVQKFSRKGFSTDVFVMNKSTLAEYEQKRRFSGSGFFVEDGKKFRRFFVSGKMKGLSAGVIISLFICLCGLFCGALCGRTNGMIRMNDEGQRNTNEALLFPTKSDEYEAELRGLVTEADLTFLWKDFLEAVNGSEGKIEFIEWSMDGFTENLSASVKGLFPENLSILNKWRKNNKNASVVYEEDIPYMKLEYSKRIVKVMKDEASAEKSDEKSNENLVKESDGYADRISAEKPARMSDSDFTKSIRETLKDFGAVLKEENTAPYHIEFTVQYKKDLKGLFNALDEIIKKDNRAVTFFSAVAAGSSGAGANAEYKTALSIQPVSVFDGRVTDGFDLNFFAEHNFNTDKNENKAPVTKRDVSKSVNQDIENYGNKIGEIKASGKTIIFYKTPEGKMEKKVQQTEVLE